MTIKKKTEGRRFSLREVEIHQIEGHDIYLVKIDYDDVWGARSIERHRQRAREILESNGINVQRFLDDSPFGSAVRDYVLNYLGLEPDSRVGLAARIFELCSHILAYQDMEGGSKVIPGLAYGLGQMVILAKAYEITSKAGSKSAQGNTNRSDPLREKIISAFMQCRNDGLSLKETLASLLNNGYGALAFVELEENYSVTYDNPDGEPVESAYNMPSLEAMFTEAGKKGR